MEVDMELELVMWIVPEVAEEVLVDNEIWRGGEQLKAGDMVLKEMDESGMEGVLFLELEIVALIMSEVEVYLMMRREN